MAIGRNNTLPADKSWLYKLMTRLGFKSNAAGMCFGIACMALQAVFLRDLVPFDNNIAELAQLFLSGASDATPSIMLWLSGIEQMQQPFQYPELFADLNLAAIQVQSALLTAYLTAFNKLNEKGGIAEVASTIGAYSETELEAYFKSLREAVESGEVTEPLSIIIRDERHAIQVGFDPTTSAWSYVNAERQTGEDGQAIYYYVKEKELAASVYQAFSSHEERVAISSKLYSMKQHAPSISASVKSWEEGNQTHLTIENKFLRGSMLILAVIDDRIELVRKLLEQDSSLANFTSPRMHTPLFLAAKRGSESMVELLLSHGAMATCRNKQGESPLDVAAQMGYRGVVNKLLAAPLTQVDPNFKRPDGFTPLYLATYYRHVEIAADLLQAGADERIRCGQLRASELAMKRNDKALLDVFKLFKTGKSTTTEVLHTARLSQ